MYVGIMDGMLGTTSPTTPLLLNLTLTILLVAIRGRISLYMEACKLSG